jgi:hypothetical protein
MAYKKNSSLGRAFAFPAKGAGSNPAFSAVNAHQLTGDNRILAYSGWLTS